MLMSNSDRVARLHEVNAPQEKGELDGLIHVAAGVVKQLLEVVLGVLREGAV